MAHNRFGTINTALNTLVIAITASLFASFPASAEDTAKWYPWLDADGSATTAGRGIGELDAFLPIWQDGTTLVFGNAKFKGDTEKSLEGNFGFGARHMLDAGWNIGAYGFFDRRFTPNGNSFNQLTLGAEALSDTFDVRVNGYLPLGTSSIPMPGLNVAKIQGSSVVVVAGAEVALGGFDAEIGYHLPIFEDDSPFDLKAYAGGFYFSEPLGTTIAGPRFRAEFTSAFDNGMRLSVGGGWQTDNVRGGQGFANLRFRVPLPGGHTGSSLSPQERRMLDPIVRDVDIVTAAGSYGPSEVATQLSNGNKLVVIDSGDAFGTNLTDALTTAGVNSTVILSGSFNISAKSTLQAGQTLMGKGVVDVKTASGQTASLTTKTATISGSINGGLGDGIIAMANNSTVRGLVLNNTVGGSQSARTIVVDSVSDATIADNTITARDNSGSSMAIVVSTSADITITGNTVNANSNTSEASAIYVGDSSRTHIANNTLNATGAAATSKGTLVAFSSSFFSGTGNTVLSGTCKNLGLNSGTVGFTNAANCP